MRGDIQRWIKIFMYGNLILKDFHTEAQRHRGRVAQQTYRPKIKIFVRLSDMPLALCASVPLCENSFKLKAPTKPKT